MHYYLRENLRLVKKYSEEGDGEYAAELLVSTKKALLDLKVNDTIDYGQYYLCGFSDPNEAKVHSPIIWRILDKQGSKLFLISEELLFWDYFDGPFFCFSGETNWKISTLRKELNEDKYNSWFTEDEKKAILETDITEDGEDMKDRIFILSEEECLKYFKEDRDRVAITRFADKLKDDEIEISVDAQPWWLRTLMEGEKKWLVIVCEDGFIDTEDGMICTADEVGVRPAMWVDVDLI